MRQIREQTFCWQEKKVLRLLRAHYDGSELSKLRCLYGAITEMDSDFNGQDIKYYTNTIHTYSGLSKEWIPQGLKTLMDMRILTVVADREGGKFKGKRLLFTPENIKEMSKPVPGKTMENPPKTGKNHGKTVPGSTVNGQTFNGKTVNGKAETSEHSLLLEHSINKEHISVAEEKRNQSWSRLKDSKIAPIYTHWCSMGMKKNSEAILKSKLKREHYLILDDISVEDAKESIANYAKVLNMNKKYPPSGDNDGWTHRLEFSAFLWKKKYHSKDETVSWIFEFMSNEDPLSRFLSRSAKYWQGRPCKEEVKVETKTAEPVEPDTPAPRIEMPDVEEIF